MYIHFQDLHTDILLEDAKGKQLLAVDVFSKSLHYMKTHLIKAMKSNLEYDPDPMSIRWVLTVPAIWDENAKQFMREAAYRVSCQSYLTLSQTTNFTQRASRRQLQI